MITLSIDGTPVEVHWLRFSDGALRASVLGFVPKIPDTVCYTVNLQECNFNELPVALHLLQDALINLDVDLPSATNTLYCDYLPYARADRRFAEHESFGLATWISQLEDVTILDKLVSLDIHNPKALDKLDLCLEVENKLLADVVRNVLPFDFKRPDVVVAPDLGAIDRATKVATKLGCSDVIFATKTRDKNTGRITSTNLPEDFILMNKSVMIVDDISDGGGTFIPLAELLKERGAREVTLLVSHGIFSRGLENLKPAIDKIYCANIIGKYISRQDLINFNSQGKL